MMTLVQEMCCASFTNDRLLQRTKSWIKTADFNKVGNNVTFCTAHCTYKLVACLQEHDEIFNLCLKSGSAVATCIRQDLQVVGKS
jgi:hypothetical protein